MITYTARGRTASAAAAVPITTRTASTDPGSDRVTTVISVPSAAQPITTKTPSRPGRPHRCDARPGGDCAALRVSGMFPNVSRSLVAPDPGGAGSLDDGGRRPGGCEARAVAYRQRSDIWGRVTRPASAPRGTR